MTDPLLLDTADRVFAATSTFEAVQRAERDGWAPGVWDAVAEIGLPWIGIPEEAGGQGGTLTDALAVLQVAGRRAAPVPLAETGVLAGWLLAAAGLPLGDGPATVVPGTVDDDLRLDGGRLHGTAHRVPWGRNATTVVALVDGHVVALSPGSARTTEELTNVAGEPRDSLAFDGVAPDHVAAAPEAITSDALRLRGALTRVALMAGALGAMAEMTARYTMERKQFGKPVGTFQAVQAHVVRVAEEAALVDLVAQVAAREAERHEARFEIASAKAVADDAARTATRAAHQAHGAMGMTQEYPLHQLSRRLWAWRAEYGDRHWPARIGRAVLAHHPDHLYEVVADGSASGITV
jgi:acyl-CoA dehydrogenase